MAIKKKPHQRSISAVSTHYPNLEEHPGLLVDAPDEMENHPSSSTMYDSEDVSPANTYTKIGARLTKKPSTVGRLRAAVDDDLPNDSNNVSTIDNDIDPLEGYDLEDNSDHSTGEVMTSLFDDVEDSEGSYSKVEDLDNSGAPAVALEGDSEDWAEPTEEEGEGEGEDEEDLGVRVEEEDGDEDGEVNININISKDEDEDEDDKVEEEGETFAIVDVDEIPEDDDGSLLAYAVSGSNLMVLRKNRVIATLSKKQAELRSTADIYTTDQFQDATTAEVRRHGLRAGLRSMGFVLAKINVAKSSVVNRRVRAQAEKLTASVRRNTSEYDKVMAQSMAIASVGINRSLFKDVPNVLRAHLEEQMQLAGIQGGQRMVRAAFAKYGVEYAKSVVTLAQKLANQPDAARKMYAEALDMTDDEGIFEDIADDVETDATVTDHELIDPSVDFVDAAEDSFDDLEEQDFEDDMFASNHSVTAALSRPGVRSSKSDTSNARRVGSISLSAAAVLRGEAPLF